LLQTWTSNLPSHSWRRRASSPQPRLLTWHHVY
jgi:hypothetical protein